MIMSIRNNVNYNIDDYGDNDNFLSEIMSPIMMIILLILIIFLQKQYQLR